MSPCDLGACNSMLPSIEFYMTANSPTYNVAHLISPFFDPPLLPVYNGQMDDRVCIHFCNCVMSFGVRKVKQCCFSVWLHSYNFSLPDTDAEPPT